MKTRWETVSGRVGDNVRQGGRRRRREAGRESARESEMHF